MRVSISRTKVDSRFCGSDKAKDKDCLHGNNTMKLHELKMARKRPSASQPTLEELQTRLQEETAKRQQAEARYQHLFDHASVMLVTIEDEDGKPVITDCNQTFAETLGYERDAVLGQSLLHFYTPPSREAFQTSNGYTGVIRGQTFRAEREFFTKDGRIVATVLHAMQDMPTENGRRVLRAMYTNVTGRKLAEEAHHSYEKKFLSAFMYSPIPMVITSLGDDIFMDVNESFLQFAGVLRRDVIGTHIDSVINLWDARDNYDQFMEEFDRENRVYNFETEYQVIATGNTGIALVSTEVLTVNTHTLLLSTLHDITPLKLAEEERQAYEKKFLSAFMHSPVPMVISPMYDNVFSEVNESYLQLIGLPREDVIGKPINSMIDFATVWENIEWFMNELERNGRVQNFETEYMMVSGKGGYALISTELITVNDQTLALSTVQDITQRKHMEKSLRGLADRLMTINDIQHNLLSANAAESVAKIALEHLAQLVPSTLGTVYRYDMDMQIAHVLASTTSPDSPIATGKQIPCPFEQRIPTALVKQIYYVPDVRELPEKNEVLSKEGVRSLIFALFVVKDEILGALHLGAPEPNAYTQEHVNIVHEVAHLLTTAVHQTNLRAELNNYTHTLEEKVQARTAELHLANAELARANRLKDEFLASMSHELRTPLTSILAKSEAFQEGVFGPMNEKQTRSVQVIEQSGRHLLSLINDILDLAKIGAGYMELHPVPTAIVTICESSLSLVRDMAQQKQVTIESCAVDPNLVLEADPQRLKQMLVNLLSNAVKFTEENGRIGLDVRVDEASAKIHFTVWDTGIGIDAERMDSIFTPFVQLDGTLARQHEGTGLGLALVSRLTKLHGGTVTVESEPGQGSRFTLSLPLKVPDRKTLGETAVANGWYYDEEMIEKRPFHILLVEDNQITAETLSDYLQYLKYSVTLAHNGQMALDIVEENEPDLILMDVQMLGMDGLEATRRLRANPERSRIPIIALTALAMTGDEERCLKAGATEYISKPIPIAKLRELVRKYEKQRGRHYAQ